MTVTPGGRPAVRPDVRHLHHVGHVIADVRAATALYRRMGFLVSPMAVPVCRSSSAASSRIDAGR
jgi:hypothetical protein